MCADAGIELSLFVGPRAGWDTGATVLSTAGRTLGAQLRGQDQLRAALDDVLRACALGIRSVLIADLGLLQVLHMAIGVSLAGIVGTAPRPADARTRGRCTLSPACGVRPGGPAGLRRTSRARHRRRSVVRERCRRSARAG